MRGEHREVYQAVVVDNADPEKRGRLLVKCGSLADGDTVLPTWAEPTFPYVGKGDAGWFFVPDIDEGVEIEVVTASDTDGVGHESFIERPQIRWRACVYQTTSEVSEIFRKDYGNRFGLKMPSGQYLLFDEKTTTTILGGGTIRLGSEQASEPLVLGNVLKTLLGAILDAIQLITVTCPPGGGPSSVPLNAATFSALKSSPVDDGAILSDIAYTEKGSP